MSRYHIKKREAHFREFVQFWNQQMNWPVIPAVQLSMIDWLEWASQKKDERLLLMAFRSSGKSTIAALFAAWLLYRNPDLRILVLAADAPLARKMVRQVKKIIEKHPLTTDMKPESPDQWAGSRFTIKRDFALRDPSMLARGVTSNITGSRADVIICDDVEVPNTCDTAEKREALREKLTETEYVLTPGGTQLYIGTPHNYFSIYADTPRAEIGEEQEFLAHFKRLEIPVLDKNGDSAWPEKFTDYALENMKRQTGPNKFASQMMLTPVNITEGRLNPDLLQVYSDELDHAKELQTLFLGERKLVGASAWWDPAFASNKGDRSVLAAVFADELGNLYLHRLLYIRNDPYSTRDEAAQQCRAAAQLAKDLFLPSISIETNGVGKFLPQILRNQIVEMRAPCTVSEITSTRPKDIRILEAFDAVLAARRLFVHESVFETPFMTEMREWRPGSRGYDDGLDAVAGAISQQPVRLPRLQGRGKQGWMKGAKTRKAKTDFKI